MSIQTKFSGNKNNIFKKLLTGFRQSKSITKVFVIVLSLALVAGLAYLGFNSLNDNLRQAKAASFTSISPNSGPTGGGTNVTLTGSGFTDSLKVTQISGGWGHTCALTSSGAVKCWGANGNGSLGYGNTNVIFSPTSVNYVNIGGIATEISTGNGSTCALLTTGSVRCWGSNNRGQLGYGNTNDIGDDELPFTAGDASVLSSVEIQSGIKVIKIITGTYHTCALLSTQNLRCWGANNVGQLGYGNTNNIGDDELPFTAGDINVGGSVSDFSVGPEHTCALLTTQNVRCWGRNSFGELGYGFTGDVGDDELPFTAGDLNIGVPVSKIVQSFNEKCVVLVTGNVRCWGYNWAGQLGIGNTNTVLNAASATDINIGGTVLNATGGDAHNCALLTTGNVRCWGFNNSGQLGYGNTNDIGDNELPFSAGDVNVGGSVSQITSGFRHNCVLLTTGNVRCWGANQRGQLGYGNTDSIGDNELPNSVGFVQIINALDPIIPTTVTFDGILASSVVVVNSTTITAITPAHSAGTVNVVVTNEDGSTSTLTNSYTYVAPTLTIQNTDISSIICAPAPAFTNTTVNCTITTNVNLNTFLGSVNLRIGASGVAVNCPITGFGTTLTCNNVPAGSVAGTSPTQYNTSGSGSTYVSAGNIIITSSPCTPGASGSNSSGNTATTNVLLCLTGGNLTIASPSATSFSSITVATAEQNTSAYLENLVIEDLRGSEAGWSLVCKSSNLAGVLDNSWIIPVYKDSSSKFNLTPTSLQVVNGYGSILSGLTDYANTQNSTGVSNDGSTGESNNFSLASYSSGFGVGKYTKNLNLGLTIPPYIRAQAYVGNLVCSVS